jgi:hypothetical protein
MTIISGLPDDTVLACKERDRNAAVAFMNAAYYVNGYGAPHYPLPVLVERTICRGLLGECVNCIWPACEH